MSNKNIILYITSPIYYISAMCAVKSIHSDTPNILLIVHYPGLKKASLKDIVDIVNILNPITQNCVKVVSISSDEIIDLIQLKNYNEKLKEFLMLYHAEEIYYPHDIDGGFCQLLYNVYPQAKRFCTGDALGLVIEKHILLSLLNQKANSPNKTQPFIKTVFINLKSIYKNKKRTNKNISQLSLKEFNPNEAILILPIDQSGSFLKKIPYRVCKKDLFLDLLFNCVKNSIELNQYISEILRNKQGKKKYLILTENFSEAQFTTFEKEIEMWCKIITNNCLKDSVIILKPHPGEILKRNVGIYEKIGFEYDIVDVDDKFKRYPIELWRELIKHTIIICMSYPIISLKYIYEKDVIQPMTNEFIEKWFEPWVWKNLKEGLSLYEVAQKRLETWDGKSILYNGNLSN